MDGAVASDEFTQIAATTATTSHDGVKYSFPLLIVLYRFETLKKGILHWLDWQLIYLLNHHFAVLLKLLLKYYRRWTRTSTSLEDFEWKGKCWKGGGSTTLLIESDSLLCLRSLLGFHALSLSLLLSLAHCCFFLIDIGFFAKLETQKDPKTNWNCSKWKRGKKKRRFLD